MTHFARADEDDGLDDQLAVFETACRNLPYPRSLANSAGVVRYREVGGDIVRPGIMLYGATPFAYETAETLGVQPVMTLRSEIIAVQELSAGDGVGYGGGSPRRDRTASAWWPAATPTAIRATRRTARRCSCAAARSASPAACRWT